MGKGESSPLRLLMRNSPIKRNVQENAEAHGRSYCSASGNNSSSKVGEVLSSSTTTTVTPQRKVLTPIPENSSSLRGGGGASAPFVVCSGDLGPSSAAGAMSIAGVKKSLFCSESLNSECSVAALVGTPERSVQCASSSTPGKSKQAMIGSLSKKSPSLAPPQLDAAARAPSQTTSIFTPTTTATTTPSRVSRSLKYGAMTNGPGTVAAAAASGVGQIGNRLPTATAGSGVFARTLSAVVPQGVTQQQQQQQFELQEDPLFWDEHNVQVLIRTRPMNTSEMATATTQYGFGSSSSSIRCLKQESANTITWIGPPESRFTFDHVAGDSVTQEKLFKVAGLPMVENCMAGYNSCMFAYGQTGSGKTHTMLGDIDNLDKMPGENRGMIPRVFEYLFARIRKEEELRKDENLMFMCRCSFLEIYNEQITDLLEPTSTNLHLREDVRKGVYVENLSEVEVHGMQDVIHLLNQGAANRKVAATNMNRESSRSHSVFTCIVKSKWERDSMTNIRFGHLNLVDLAGSERQKSSGAEGERLKEAANINKSLSTLGLVIMILVDVANGKQRHVPYRDSKLTFLLQDSLGGNSKTTIIATVSPASCNALETLSTLKFAQRAKLIQNTAIVNEDASGDVTALHRQIQQMKEELDRVRRQNLLSIPSDLPADGAQDLNRAVGSPSISRKEMRAMEALVAGALRREQEAYGTTQRLAAEIEQLNRLVQQREEESQCGKMILRFREDKIKRLEFLSQGSLSIESYLMEEKRVLVEELQLLRARIDRNPELTRFAAENIRLLDHIKSLKEFQQGDRDVMAQEIVNLRDKLLDVLEGKIALEQGLVPLTTPQKKLLVPEIAANAREIELLRIEADNYRSELDECRNNLTSCLQSQSALERQIDELQGVVNEQKAEATSELGVKAHENELLRIEADRYRSELDECQSKLTSCLQSQVALERQVDELQGVVEELKSDSCAKEVDLNLTAQVAAVEEEQRQNARLIADLRLELQQSEERAKLEASRSESLELELKAALQESQDLHRQLQESLEHEAMLLEECDLCTKEVEERLLAAELMVRRSCAESKDEPAACKLEKEEEKVEEEEEEGTVVGAAAPAAEKTLLLSVTELQSLQLEHEKMVRRLKRREDRERFLKRKINQLEWELMKEDEQKQELRCDGVESEVVKQQVDIPNEPERSALVDKLDQAKKELAMAQELNAKFQQEQVMMSAQQQEMDWSRSQAEMETALAITSMQAQLMDMENEMQVEKERLAAEANEEALQLASVVSEKGKELSLAREEWYSEKEMLIKTLSDTEKVYAETQHMLSAMKDCMKEVEIRADALSMEVKVLTIARESWEEEKACLEMEVSEMKVENERLAVEVNEALQLVSTVSEKGLSEWNLEKEMLIKTLMEMKQEYAKAQQTLETMKDCMKEAEIRATAMSMELKELTRARLVWDEEKIHLQREVLEMQLENKEILAVEVDEALQIASMVFEKEQSILMEAWSSEKATLIKRLNVMEQEYVAVKSALCIMTDRMEQAEIQADEELGIARQAWENEKACLEREVSEMQVEIERLSRVSNQALLPVVASDVSDEEQGFLCERDQSLEKERTQIVTMGETDQDQHVAAAAAAPQQEPLLVMSYHCMEVEAEIQVDALPVEMKELAIAKQAWEEEKVCLEREISEMWVANERLSHEANEALQLTSQVSEKEQELAMAMEAWNVEKETLMKTLSTMEQKYVAAQRAWSIVTGQMDQAEIQTDAISMEMEERTTAITTRQPWELEEGEEEEECHLERDVVVTEEEMLVENESLAVKVNEEALQSAISEKLAHENELLRIETEKYNSELIECRAKLVSCLQSHTVLERQLNELRDVVEDLELEALEKQRDLNMAAAYATVVQEMAQAQNVQIIANLKLELQQSEENVQLEVSKCESLNLELKLAQQESCDLYQHLQELAHETMLLTSAICEKEQGVLFLKEEWSFGKALILKIVNETKQEFAELQRQLLSMMKAHMEEGAIQANELLTQRMEFNIVRKAWEEKKKMCLEREFLAETSVCLEQYTAEETLLRTLDDENGLVFSGKDNGVTKQVFDIVKEELKTMTEKCERLEVGIQNRDNTISCAQMELVAAQSHYKEAEMEIEKTMQGKEKLVEELMVAKQEINARQREVEALENEMLKVMVIVAETQAQMVELEGNWRREREMLLMERDEARFFAHQQSRETVSLTRNFETNQAALGEAEMVVDALVQAKLSAKSDAEGWKFENERLFLAQELATKNAELDTIAALAMVQDEVDMTIDLCLRVVGSLAEEIESLREEMVLGTVNKELKTEFLMYKEDISKAQEKAQTTMVALHEKLQGMETIVQEKMSEVVRLQTALDELQCSQAVRCAAEAEIKALEERNHLQLERMETLLQEDISEDLRLQAALGAVEGTFLPENTSGEVVRLQAALGASEDELWCSEAAAPEIKALEEKNDLQPQMMEKLLQENMNEVVRLQAALDVAEDELRLLQAMRCTAEAEIRALEEKNHLQLQRMEKLLQENRSEVVRLQAALGAAEDELQHSQAARCTAEAEIKAFEERKHLELQSMEKLLQENMNEVVRLQAALDVAEDELRLLQAMRCTAEAEIRALEEKNHLQLQRMEKLLQENRSEVVRLQAALGAAEDELQHSQAARCTAEAEIKAFEERKHLELQSMEKLLQENMNEVVRLQTALGAVEDELQSSQAAGCTAEAEVKTLEESKHLELQSMKKLLQENMNEVVRLQTVLGAAEDELQSSQAARCTAEAEVKTLEEIKHLELQRVEKLLQENMNEVVRLQTVLGAVEDELQRSQAARCTAEAEIKALEERNHCTAKSQQEVTAVELESAKAAVAKLLASVSEKDLSIVELHSKLEEKNEHLIVIKSTHLEVMTKMKAELLEKVKELDLLQENTVASAACQEQEYSQLKEHNINLQAKVAALESELDAIQTDLLLLKQELEAAKAHATQQEAITTDVYEAATLLKSHVNRGEEEVSSLGESLSRILNDLQEAQATKEDKERKLQELESELTQANNQLEILQTQCQEKDIQIENSKTRIADLMQAAVGQATEYQQKLKSLEAMVEQVKAEDRRASLGFPVTPKAGDKRSKSPFKGGGSPFKGPGSPFKCMGKGLSQQMNSELDAELSAHQRRIEELDALATSRQKEIFLLNTRLAEAESMTHDIVRELLGVKLDISNYAVTQQQVQKFTAQVGVVATTEKITTQPPDQEADEMTHIRSQLNDFIEERESWLEEINRRQAEMVAARVSVEKMRQRNQALMTENENLKAENTEHQKRIGELEKDVKKLSGQQNIQQRIHHHARIKEENNALRLQNEDLNVKLRRSDILFARVNDELARYRIADGKTPFLNIDEEQCLRSKLQEAEESNVQMAQKFVSLCTSILQVAGISQHGKEMDQSLALEGLKQIEDRLQSMEQEISDLNLKTRIAGEKRRLSELRAVHSSPMKPSNFFSPQR